MARVYPNPLFRCVSGRIGNVIYRQVNGRTYASAVPRKSTLQPTDAQLAQRARFAAMARARAAEARQSKQGE